MRAGLRFTTILLAFGTMVPAAAAVAQDTTPPATTNTPATDAIGPRELQNFSLPGTRTRPADSAPTAPVVNAPPPRTDSAPAEARTTTSPASRSTRMREASRAPSPASTPPISTPQSTTTPTLAQAQPATAPFGATTLPATPVPQPIEPAGPSAATGGLSLWPWIAAALALALGGLFLFWRRHHSREEFAGGPQFDSFVAPEPTPPLPPIREPQLPPIPRAPLPPAAAPTPQPAAKPSAPVGIVSSRLRPAIEIGVQPLRCLVEDDQVTIEFELELFNSGTAPARGVLAEASLFNAGATQDEQLTRFFANPVGTGSGIDAIPPLKRINLTSKVVAPRDAIQEYELGGRRAFVPVIAFNALYDWSGGKAQTSSAYLVGRETRGDKLGPLHLDEAAKRDVRGLGARELPSQLRT